MSIGLPTFNRASRIERTLDSLLAQSYKNFELIISDNASTDATQQICEEYAKNDKRIRYIRQRENIGVIKNIEFVFRQARGEYFMWTSDDDWCDPNFIMALKTALDKNPAYGVAMSSLRRVFDDGQIKDEIIYSGKNNVTKFSHGKIFSANIKSNPADTNFFILGLWRINILRRLFYRPLPDAMGPDNILIYEASFMTHFYSVPEILFYKTVYRTGKSERHGEEVKKHYAAKKSMVNFTKVVFKRLLTSSNISIYRKIFSLPPKLFLILWVEKRPILSESLPFLKKIKILLMKMRKINPLYL